MQSRHRGSSSRSSSSRSSTSSSRCKTQVEQVAFLARAAALKDKHALEEQELILRRKGEQLQLDTEIAATTAKLAVLQVGSGIHSRQSDGMDSYFRKGARSKLPLTSLNPQASIFVPVPAQQHASILLQSNASPLFQCLYPLILQHKESQLSVKTLNPLSYNQRQLSVKAFKPTNLL